MTTNGAESFLTTNTSDTDAWEWDNDIGLANATDALGTDAAVLAKHQAAAWVLFRRLVLAWTTQIERSDLTGIEEMVQREGSAAFSTKLN